MFVKRFAVIDYFRFDHLSNEIITLASPLADTSEDRETAMLHRYVVNQFHDEDGFAHTGTAEEANFSTSQEGLKQINNLNSCHKHFEFCGLILKIRGVAMNRILVFSL